MNQSQHFLKKVGLWTSFYRENPHRFAHDYLGINLKTFQMILIFMMDKMSFFMYLAARGQGKSFIISIYAIIRAILYPNSQIIIASGTKNQAALIVKQYIEKMRRNSPNLAKEIMKINTGKDECSVIFFNGSTIEAVVSTDGSRGYRGNILICEEFRMIKPEILNKVLRRFNATPRQPKYLIKKEYAHLKESNKELYISSAWYRNHWSYEKFKSFVRSMIEGKHYFVCGLPYHLSIAEDLLDEQQVKNETTEEDHDPISWLMEMECLFWGESEKAYYKLDHFIKNRSSNVKPFYPLSTVQFLETKSKKSILKKNIGEIRAISVDVAMMGGNANDNTIFTCIRLIPKDEKYIRYTSYIESINGQHSETQAILLKRLYQDFEADYIVMDTQGNGISLYDDCSKILFDRERNVEYPAWSAMNNEKMRERALDKNALPIIFSITTNQETNHHIAVKLKDNLEKGKSEGLPN
jgi:hypothetical protein